MDNLINKITQDINISLKKIEYDKNVINLYNPIEYTLDNGGKRIRPLLMIMAYSLYKDDYEKIMNCAVALEVYHNFTLLHDDVMDNAYVRRGKPCVHVKWDENTAILSGDAMLIMAYQLMTKDFSSFNNDKYSTDNFRRALNTFNQATLGVCEGQQFDMDFEKQDHITENQYMEMIRLKTSLLLSCALKIGAQLAGADDNDVNLLAQFGEKIGLAFQLQDDLLDVYADEKVFGKAVGGDIAENKKTFMLIKTLELANEQQRKHLEYWLKLKHFDKQQKYLAVKEIYDQLNISDICNKKIESLFSEAINALNNVNAPEEKKEHLRLLSYKLMKRNS